MRHINATKVFISAYRPELTPEQATQRTFRLVQAIEALDEVVGFRRVTGFFDGNFETSVIAFLQVGSILDGIDKLRDLARRFEQDSILVVHGDNAAELVECHTDSSAIIGRFQVAEDGPEPGEDYTLADSTYYVVR